MANSSYPEPANSVAVPYSGGTLFDWEEGKVKPKGAAPMAKEQAQGVYHAVAALPYQGEWDPEVQQFILHPKYRGLTVQEVITLKHAENAMRGDQSAINSWQDRIMGKPKQSLEAVTMTLSYTEFLDSLAAQDDEPEHAIDVQAVHVEDEDLTHFLDDL